MGELDPGRARRGEVEPGVFLLPLALPESISGLDVDAEVLARRLPDLLHQLLNAGRSEPAGMLEIQSPPDEGPPRWVTLSDVPSAEEVFTMLGGDRMRALVTGSLRGAEGGLAIDLSIHFADEDGLQPTIGDVPQGVHAVVRLDDPSPGVLRLARHLAEVLEVPFRAPTGHPRLLTRSPAAFFRYLEGLDGAALLSGDPDLESDRYGESLLQPFGEALRIDPGFGLALRSLADALFPALTGERVPDSACYRLLDEVLEAEPTDGEGCVAIAEQLGFVGDRDRSRAWLEHAVGLDPVPPRALEGLGVYLANAGEIEEARALWRRGIEIDGHPDFLAHLARLAFNEGRSADGWDLMLRGLWRKLERLRRSAEWDDEVSGGSVLLRYLAEHIDEGELSEDAIEAIEELVGEVDEPIERVDLALCLRAVGRDDLAESELRGAMEGELPPSVEDRAVRALLGIELPDFERKFQAASERAVHGRDPRSALVEMQACLERNPAFWPALFYAGIALRRLGHQDEALDLMNEVVQRRPGQTDALTEMAEMFDARGNPKRALECVDEALLLKPEDADLHVLRAQFLEHLGRSGEAGEELDRAIALEGPVIQVRRSRRA